MFSGFTDASADSGARAVRIWRDSGQNPTGHDVGDGPETRPRSLRDWLDRFHDPATCVYPGAARVPSKPACHGVIDEMFRRLVARSGGAGGA